MLTQLPAGAVRLGTTAFRFPKNYDEVYLTTNGRGFIAYDIVMDAYWRYDLATGAPQQQLAQKVRGWEIQWDTLTPSQQVVVFNQNIPAPWEVRQLPSGDVVAKGSVPCAMANLSPDGCYLVEAVVNEALAQRQADQDMEDHFVNEARVYDLANRKPIHVIKPVHNYCIHAHFSPTSEYLALTGDYANEGDDDIDSTPFRETIQIIDMADGTEVLRLRIPRLVADAGVLFVPGHAWFLTHEVTKQDMQAIVVRSIKTGKVVQKYELGEDGSNGPLRMSPNGRFVAVCGNSCLSYRVDLEKRVVLKPVEQPFEELGFSPKTYESTWRVADDGTVQFLSKLGAALVPWSAPHRPPSPALAGPLNQVTVIGFSADGQTIRTGGAMSRVYSYDRTGKRVRTDDISAAIGVDFFLNDTTLNVSRAGITQYSLTTGEFQRVEVGEGEQGGPSSLNTDCTQLVRVVNVEDDDGEAHFSINAFDLANETDRVLLELPGVQRAAALWCGEMLVVLTYNEAEERSLCGYLIHSKKVTEVWSQTVPVEEEVDADKLGGYVHPERPSRFANRFTPLWPFDAEIIPHPNAQTVLVVPPDGRRLPFIVNVLTGELIGTWKKPVRGPFAVHPTRDMVAVVDRRGDDVQLLDWRTGEVVQTILAGAYPTALAWSPDGATLAVGLPDTTVVLVPVK